MKTSLTKSAAAVLALFLFPLFSVVLFAQQSSGDKKITITKKTLDKDGSETTETIVKKGKAAENFDADAYLKANKTAETDVDIRIEDGSDNVSYYDYESDDARARTFRRDRDDQNWNWAKGSATSWGGSCGDDQTRGFLGVEQDSDEDRDAPGLAVQVTRNSAAAKAGLKTNDVILQLGDTKTDRWEDLSGFLNKTKPGDKIQVTYRRGNDTKTVEAAVGSRKEVNKANCDAPHKRGFLGVNEVSGDDKDEPGIEVDIVQNSAAEKAGLQDGDLVLKLDDVDVKDWEDLSDFMDGTEQGQKIKVTYNRDGKTNTAEATAGEPKNTFAFSGTDFAKGLENIAHITAKEKEACIGVYSEAFGEGAKKGARIDDFTTESAAREAQMQVGDVIVSVNGQRVKGHNDLWNEIAKFKTGDKVSVEYLRADQTKTIEATLKACRDKSSVIVWGDPSESGQRREFRTWNWSDSDRQRLRERAIITIRKGEGDAPKVNQAPASDPPAPAADRNLQLENFRAYPNPTQGQVTVEFRGEPVPTTVSLFDLAGRQLYSEELNGFNGDYNQQFDLTAYAKGTILVQVVQAGKVFTEQIVVN